MTDLTSILAQVKRPKLLVRAARMGLMNYRFERDLPGAARSATGSKDRVKVLLSEEQRLEDGRQCGDSTYSIQSHVGILTALIAEARLRGAALSPQI